MPLELLDLLLILDGSLRHAGTAGGHVHGRLVLDGHLHRGAILGEDITELALEIRDGERLADVTVGEDGVAAIGLADGFQKQPTAQEAILVGGGEIPGGGDHVLLEVGRGVGVDRLVGILRIQAQGTGEGRQSQKNFFHAL